MVLGCYSFIVFCFLRVVVSGESGFVFLLHSVQVGLGSTAHGMLKPLIPKISASVAKFGCMIQILSLETCCHLPKLQTLNIRRSQHGSQA